MASGFVRLILRPASSSTCTRSKVYADVERPLYQRFTGNQLAATLLYRLNVSFMF